MGPTRRSADATRAPNFDVLPIVLMAVLFHDCRIELKSDSVHYVLSDFCARGYSNNLVLPFPTGWSYVTAFFPMVWQ